MRSVLLIALSFFPLLATAQLTGRVTSKENDAIPFANVILLLASDSTLAGGTTTNDNGNFNLSDPFPGRYTIRVSAVGNKVMNLSAFDVAGKAIDFGTLVLEDDLVELDEVVIKADKPLYEQQINKTIINVGSSVMTKGSSALQLLERSPGVFVDLRNGAIALNGKAGVMVMLNGKLMRLPVAQLMTMLQSMSANDIETIELLPTPPASMDADGNAGMINIVMKKKSILGTSGSFTVTAGHGYGEKGSSSLSLQHTSGTATWYGSYSFIHDNTFAGWSAVSTQNMPALGGRLKAEVANTEHVISDGHNATFGVDMRSKSIEYGGNVSFVSNRADRDVHNRASYTLQDSDSVLFMDSNVLGASKWRNTIAGVYASKTFTTGDKLSVDADYMDYFNQSPTQVTNLFSNKAGAEVAPAGAFFSKSQSGSAKTPIQVGVFKMDYSTTINARLSAEAGVKGTLTRSTSSSAIESLVDGEWVTSSRASNDIRLKERIAAVYLSFEMKINPSTALTAGTRYENSRTYTESDKEENRIDRKISKIFPNVLFSKKLNDHTSLQFNWSKRISRPSYNDLASFIQYTDPMSAFTGNPLLRPTITNNISAGINFKGYVVSLLASRDDFPIVRYQLSENATRDLMYVRAQNMAWQNNLMLSTSVPLKIVPWWNMTFGVTGGLRQFKVTHTLSPVKKAYFAYNLNGTQTFALPGNFSIEISGWFTSDQYDGSKKLQGFGAFNAGLKKDFGTRGGSVQLGWTDLLMSVKIINRYGSLTEEAFDVKSYVPYLAESARYRLLRLTYSKSFGGKSIGETKRRSQEESNRLRKD